MNEFDKEKYLSRIGGADEKRSARYIRQARYLAEYAISKANHGKLDRPLRVRTNPIFTRFTPPANEVYYLASFLLAKEGLGFETGYGSPLGAPELDIPLIRLHLIEADVSQVGTADRAWQERFD